MSEKGKAKRAKELYELKQKAFAYYQENGVPEKMENILNNMFYDNPNDVFGHLANYFEKFSKTPTVSKILGRTVYDSKAQPTLQTEIYCTIKNFEKLIQTSTSTNDSFPSECAKPEEVESASQDRAKNIDASLGFIEDHIKAAIIGKDPTKQEELDDVILGIVTKIKEEADEQAAKDKEEKKDDDAASQVSGKPGSTSPTKRKSAKGGKPAKGPAVVIVPDEPRESLLPGCNVVAALSQSLCETGARISDKPLYEYIANIRSGEEVVDKFSLPLPMVTILSSGRVWPGKQNCVKEFMLVPKPDMPMKECIKHITEIYNYCAKSLSAKTGIMSRNVNDIGALCPTFDKPEQGLDLLQEAITHQGLTPAEDFHIALNLQGQEIFDYEKGKYDVVVGLQKTGEDLPDFYGDLLSRYPAIIALIDPLRKVEKESWMRLCERVSDRCYIIGDSVWHRPGLLIDEELTEDFKASGIVLRLENMNTITHLITASKKMQDAENEIILSTQTAESTDTFLVDLAVGLNCHFLKVGAPCRGERIGKLNRLLQIEEHLSEKGQLSRWPEHVFPSIKPPTPPPEQDDAPPTTPDSRPPSEKK